MRGSYLVLVCLKSIYQPLWLFSRLFFLCLFDMRASQKVSRTALMFLNFDLSEHSGLMYLGGGSLAPSSLSSLSSKDINWIALWGSNKAFILALSTGESCALSNTSVRFVNYWSPKNLFSLSGVTTVIDIWLTFTLFSSNSLVWQNIHLVFALHSEQFTLQSNLTYKWQGHC